MKIAVKTDDVRVDEVKVESVRVHQVGYGALIIRGYDDHDTVTFRLAGCYNGVEICMTREEMQYLYETLGRRLATWLKKPEERTPMVID